MDRENFDLQKYLDEKRALVNQWLSDYIDRSFERESRLCRAMAHSLMAGGKRLRPVICIASAETVGGGDTRQVTACGCAIEMIHTYSLIHDDLPAMDNDSVRRGRPTCHVEFDEATAILAGDGLLTLAFEILAGIGAGAPEGIMAMHRIARAAGFQGMIEGQMRDMDAEGKALDLEFLKEVHQYKTGALIKASVVSGALLAGGTAEQIDALSEYAENIGLAFQVTDDILNVEGDPALMGKAAGTDLDREKSTYPGIMGLDESKKFAEELADNALNALSVFGGTAGPLSGLAGYIIERRR